MSLFSTFRFIRCHPLNRTHPFSALGRWLAWQAGSRLLPWPVAVPFVGGTRLLVRRGMAGATGNLYGGLAEFQEMGLVLHALRPGDWFVDAGANIGAYTVLASGVCGASSVAIEPIPKTVEGLLDNIHLNRLENRVTVHARGVGSAGGNRVFAAQFDSINHVLAPGESQPADAVTVPVEALDGMLAGIEPALIKIDVEGYEAEVVKGASEAFGSGRLLAVIMELNGSGARYGFDDARVYDEMRARGFVMCHYNPLTRALTRVEPEKGKACNAIFVKNEVALAERLKAAPRRTINGVTI